MNAMKDKNLIFDGIATALITPFCDGKIDFGAFGALIDFQINEGVDALVVCGTTGESSCMTDSEKLALFEFSVSRVRGRVPVIAGVGCSDTRRTAAAGAAACELGCDALLVVTPYYNRPTPNGLYEHYRTVSAGCQKPVIAYNVPSRTGVSIPVDVLKRLFDEGYVSAIKEACGDLSRIAKIISECPNLTVYSGNDDQTLPIAALGGKGVISVTSNICPREMCEAYRAFSRGETERSAELQRKLSALESAMFCEVNPIPIKYAAYLLGLCKDEYRLPLCPPTDESKKKIALALENFKA